MIVGTYAVICQFAEAVLGRQFTGVVFVHVAVHIAEICIEAAAS